MHGVYILIGKRLYGSHFFEENFAISWKQFRISFYGKNFGKRCQILLAIIRIIVKLKEIENSHNLNTIPMIAVIEGVDNSNYARIPSFALRAGNL